ncbi:putative nad-p-binding protein [Botrytis fragariae]|uniref:Putative nad-p-binding protein n=1 Tax=Botrytis fragariae TaxID=1964551 RepID=A0A8H6EP66_9HELO|nr:putative nad-p-binding protein [Botrytis fragariae]KAF5879452.1 putative nad-p-binding protein [Botrytis fragariae]
MSYSSPFSPESDTPELAADTISYLTSQKRKWLAGRYLSSNWDVNEIMSREEEIVDEDKLKFKMNL